jgi:DNA-directed RNA polymerase specialized sigma24 family protein
MNKTQKNTDGVQAIDEFLANIEAEAFRIAELATKNTVDAMDIVELAVKRWVKHDSHKPDNQWLFLFYKTLFTAIADFERKEIPSNRWFNPRNEIVCLQDIDPTDKSIRSAAAAEKAEFNKALIGVLGHLPLPQQQAFFLCQWQGFSAEQVARMLSEAPLIIVNRLNSALMGLQEALSGFNEEGDAGLNEKIMAALKESAADISYAQQYQLRHIRLQALKQKQPKPIVKWVLPTALMALCLFVFWWLQLPQQTPAKTAFYSSESLTANEPQAWQESVDLLDNFEFYAWLSLQDGGAVEVEAAPVNPAYSWSNLSAKEKEIARERFAQWEELTLERKALLRNEFAMFNWFNPAFQRTLRKVEADYAKLPSEQQEFLRSEWENASTSEKKAVRALMKKAQVLVQ